MKGKIISYNICIKIVSAACILLPLVLVRIMKGDASFLDLSLCSIFVADVQMLLLPVLPEDALTSFIASVALAALFLAIVLVTMDTALICLVACGYLMGYTVLRLMGRYANVRSLFQQSDIWTSVETHARMFYVCVTLLLGVLLEFGFLDGKGGGWVELALLLILFILLHLRSYTGRTLFLRAKKEDIIINFVRGNLRQMAPEPDIVEDTARMRRFYQKIIQHMETDKPFLDPEYGLANLARSMCTNNSYLSKTINTFSGRNFRQFVNYFRVMCAVEEIKRNPSVKVMELYSICGFHSVVTFNLAFKLNMGDTPSEFIRNYKVSRL